jgi:hypothetical protein
MTVNIASYFYRDEPNGMPETPSAGRLPLRPRPGLDFSDTAPFPAPAASPAYPVKMKSFSPKWG